MGVPGIGEPENPLRSSIVDGQSVVIDGNRQDDRGLIIGATSVIPSSRRYGTVKKKKCGRARLRPGRDIAVGIAFAKAVQTELDPPTAAVQTELDPPTVMGQTFFESLSVAWPREGLRFSEKL